MIKNIIFDVAKVLMAYDAEGYAVTLGGDPERMLTAVKITEEYPQWSEIDLGVKSEDEVFEDIVKANPEYAAEIRLFYRHWYEVFQPMDGMEELLARLKAAGYGLYYLSNFPEKAFLYVKKHLKVFRIVEKGLVSYQVGLVKPDPAIYRLALERFGLTAEECIFTDDRPANTAAAAQLGFATHTFTTPARFEDYLRTQGLEF